MRRSLVITILVLFGFWLASVAALLLYVADLAGVPALVAAIVVQIGVAVSISGLLLVTNTRVNWSKPDTTEPITLADNQPYGRRQTDDRSVVDRLSAVLEEAAAQRPGPAKTPDWAIGIHGSDAGEDES